MKGYMLMNCFCFFLYVLRVLVNEDVLYCLVCFGGDMILVGDDGGCLVLLNLILESNVGVKNNILIIW